MNKKIKLSEWAKQNGIGYRTAWNLFKQNKLPVKATQLPTGTILIEEEAIEKLTKCVALYARVSSHDQKQDLEKQLDRLRDFASSKGYEIIREETEIASGLSDKRKKLLSILEDKQVDIIIVEHKDRFVRFGNNIIISLMKQLNKELIIINNLEVSDDLVKDMIDIITCFCSKIYGRRSAKNKRNKVISVITDEN